MPLASGTRFALYDVSALIGVGGMGEVYRARDSTLRRDVALKVLPDSFAGAADRVARFEREATTLAALNHPNIAQIYGLERQGDATALVMELVEGPTLAERIGRGPLPPSEALDIATQIAAALEAAHEQGIVHRDLKPANIKLKTDGTVKVLDFGIAKALEPPGIPVGTRTSTGMTEAGMVLGTLPYMSPEQARGQPVDKRTDIWAFGCVLYEMLTGRAAFLRDDASSTLASILERDPDMSQLPAELPSAARQTLELCLQKSLKHRARDIGDVRLALEGKFSAPPEKGRSNRWRVLPIAAALLVGVLGANLYRSIVASPTDERSPGAVTRFVITPPATAPLSNLGGHDFALSPDGQRLAYLGLNAARTGVALYVRELDSLEPRLLAGTEVLNPSPNVNPFFSTDSRSIGVASPDGSVIRARIDGTPPVKMFQTQRYFGATWVTDDSIVVATGTRLERVSPDGGGTPEPLTQEVTNEFVAAPSALPGGNAVLFMSRAGDVPRIAVLDLETREQSVLIEGAQKPVYASTGHIVFARGATLMAAPFDAAKRVLTGEPVALLDGLRRTNNNSPDFALSATGTLAYVPGDGRAWRGALVWVDRTGNVVGRAVPESLDGLDDPRLSPDGTRVVVSIGTAGDGHVWAYDLRGRPPIPLTIEAGGGDPVWSPDGLNVAFTDFSMTDWPVHVVPANGGGVAQPVPDAMGIAQDWTASGELLVVANRDIRASYVGGGGTRNVIATAYNEFDAALSPDGNWVAYVSDRTGQGEIWVQRYPDGAHAPIRVSRSGGYEPRWSADGKELFYLQGSSMYAVAVDAEGELLFGAPELLFNGSFLETPSPETRSFDVARDGRFLMIQADEATAANDGPASIVIVENWFEELKRRVPTQ